MKTQICSKCKIRKEIISFSKNKSKPGGFSLECKDCVKNYLQIYYKENRDKIYNQKKIYSNLNKEKIKEYKKLYHKLNRVKICEQHRIASANRLKIDIIFKLRKNLQRRLNHSIKNNLKNKSTLELLGCSITEFKNHLENQFKPGMSWENHSLHGWHIDHIKPCASFDLSDHEQQKLCFHYSNLQPLWAKENLEKSDKILV